MSGSVHPSLMRRHNYCRPRRENVASRSDASLTANCPRRHQIGSCSAHAAATHPPRVLPRRWRVTRCVPLPVFGLESPCRWMVYARSNVHGNGRTCSHTFENVRLRYKVGDSQRSDTQILCRRGVDTSCEVACSQRFHEVPGGGVFMKGKVFS